jgi:hypothetical protein
MVPDGAFEALKAAAGADGPPHDPEGVPPHQIAAECRKTSGSATRFMSASTTGTGRSRLPAEKGPTALRVPVPQTYQFVKARAIERSHQRLLDRVRHEVEV